MSIVSLLLNILWIIFGGLWMAVGWVIAAVLMAVTIALDTGGVQHRFLHTAPFRPEGGVARPILWH
jgi:uncharacterized membrane protein YccF (DUF307 family)